MKHGMSGTRMYRFWCGMKQRCEYPRHNRFKSYGAKGIKVYKRWQKFVGFYMDMHELYLYHSQIHGEKNTTIDRIDPSKGYYPKNCRFNTLWNQNLNRTNNHLLTYKDETKPLTQWAREKGFKRGLLENHIRRGWSVKKILETPSISKFSPSKKHQPYCTDGLGNVRFNNCICK